MSLEDKCGVVFKGQDAGVRLCPFFNPALAIWWSCDFCPSIFSFIKWDDNKNTCLIGLF